MFAVPGWSIQASALKTQRTDKEPSKAVLAKAQQQPSLSAKDDQLTKKRKREIADNKGQEVNAKNLAELWGKVIEGVEQPKKKKEKYSKSEEVSGKLASNERGDGEKPKKRTLKEKKRERKLKLGVAPTDVAPKHVVDLKIQKPPTQSPSPQSVIRTSKAPGNLTPLQASMRQKLVSARFRHLNQTLYTTPSAHSLTLFSTNPEMFTEYHEGFRRQVEVWPENPVDGYIAHIKARAKVRSARHKGVAGEDNGEVDSVTPLMPLPRTEGVCHVADLGCGDAGISHGLEKEKKRNKVAVYSYDLQSPSALVTRADIANLPLDDSSVDIAIFCLALMGTNWIDFIEEAWRILRWKGELWVAEIKSRFGRVGKGGKKVVEHSVGNRKKLNKKDMKRAEGEADEKDLLVEVDGQDVPQETDVSAFVEVLRKRGFVLQQNDESVDLRNKMFVRMSFVKAATPIKGKCVPVPKGMEKMGLETWKKKPKGKFIEKDEEILPVSSESGVLKPCVYKIR